jgi:singapore isolate B (sub-type 7) whole genome shotgun sequence assembly, scaffold_28
VEGTVMGIILLFISCTVSSLKGIITKRLLSGNEPLSTFQLLNMVELHFLSHAELAFLLLRNRPRFSLQRFCLLEEMAAIVGFHAIIHR